MIPYSKLLQLLRSVAVAVAVLLVSTVLCEAGNVITSGTTVKVSPSTVMSSSSDFSLSAGGTLNNQGTLVLKGNLTNQNGTSNSLGTGTFEFSGTSGQTISGPNVFGNVVINNTYGVTVSDVADNEVDGSLTLSTGLLVLGTKNLLLGPSATVGGTPTATNMVVATNTGQLRKNFTGTGSFTFPVGDNTGTAEYTPVTLNFTGGSFSSAYAGVNLTDAKYPDDSIATNYISRYWNLTQSGITGFTCNATFNYVTADLTGDPTKIYCVRVNPWTNFDLVNNTTHQLTANGLSSFSTFTGAGGQLLTSLTVYMEGPYNAGTGLMSTTLKINGLIPLSQPYGTSTWAYTGPEAVASIPANVVDWVLVELRQASTPGGATTSFRKRAAFLKADGSIVDLDGVSPLRFSNVAVTSGNYLYPVIRHRNQLAIMAGDATGASQNASGTYVYDFSTALTKAYGGALGYKQIGSSPVRFGMVAGDIDEDGNVFATDYNIWAINAGLLNVYTNSDITFDGNVFVSDYNMWAVNAGTSHPISAPIRPGYISQVP
jgi:hypothetical protein